MNTVKSNSKKMHGKSSDNPFAKAVEDKKKITAAIQEGKSLSRLKGIRFVKPL